jgi:phosphoglycolate phosphatase
MLEGVDQTMSGAMEEWMLSSLKSVVWDFNGTLLNDLDLAIRVVNEQLKRRGLPLLTEAAYRDVFGFPVKSYYRRIGLNSQADSMAELSEEFFTLYDAGVEGCSLQDGAVEMLQWFASRGVRQFVLSAMEENRLHEKIHSLGIEAYFDGVYGLPHLEADSKLSRGSDLVHEERIETDSTLLIGDTTHDAKVASKLGMHVVLIAQGHQSQLRLQEALCPILASLRVWFRALPDGTC